MANAPASGRCRLMVGVMVSVLLVAATGLLVVRWLAGATSEVGARDGEPAHLAEWCPARGDWPCWRGPDGTGCSTARPPLRWSSSQGIAWRQAVPGRGHASPVLCKDRLFLVTSSPADRAQSLRCYRAATGELLWETTTLQGGWMPLHEKNTHASSTPACDGERVFVAGIAHGGLWVTAVGLDGKQRWQRRVGPFVSQHGYASAVALHRGLVLVAGENRGSKVSNLAGVTSYLAALSRKTGEVVWLVRRPTLPSYGTPTVGQVAGGPQVALAGAMGVSGFDPLTGRLLWESAWVEGRTAASVAFGGGRVFASRTIPGPQVVAVDTDRNEAAAREPVWSQTDGAADVPSPLWHAGKLYLLSDQGFLRCLDDASGEPTWALRLSGAFSASPVLAGGRLYCTNERGLTFVVAAEGKGKVLARNPLNEAVYATPVPAEGRLYIRTESSLICVEEASASAGAPPGGREKQ